jgi:TDG/mug DNA glycosylase family protein
MPLYDIVGPGLRVVIVGTIAARHRAEREHYYAGRGNAFWVLLHRAGLTSHQLAPEQDVLLPKFGIGLTDLVWNAAGEPGLADLHATLGAARPHAVAFVSKTAAASYARAAAERQPRGYGELSWPVAARPAFVLPGPSGANNGMPLLLRIAMWRDLADFLDAVLSSRPTAPSAPRR